MTQLLERKEVSISSALKNMDEVVAQEAAELLGYNQVNDAITLAKALGVLQRLEIKPFDDKMVKAYKKRQIKDAKEAIKGFASRYSFNWTQVALSKYTAPVPAFALARALELKKAFNKENLPATFKVDSLIRRTSDSYRDEMRSRAYDPFMVLEVCGKNFFIDVWDEPKFEGRRTR